MDNEKKIIIAVVIFLVFSFGFLFYFEKKQLSLANAGWETYFEDPKSNNLIFVIENNGKTKKFHWKEIAGSNANILKESDVTIPAGQKSLIPLLSADTPRGEKITIEVSDNTGKKEIYKFLN
jgi:hypothetical protein